MLEYLLKEAERQTTLLALVTNKKWLYFIGPLKTKKDELSLCFFFSKLLGFFLVPQYEEEEGTYGSLHIFRNVF